VLCLIWEAFSFLFGNAEGLVQMMSRLEVGREGGRVCA
jgi:hypothetical protein